MRGPSWHILTVQGQGERLLLPLSLSLCVAGDKFRAPEQICFGVIFLVALKLAMQNHSELWGGQGVLGKGVPDVIMVLLSN